MQNTLVIIVDDEVAAFLASQNVSEPGDYVNQLLRREKERRQQSGKGRMNAGEISDEAPDTSGYPEMKGHFYD